jgi:hypothetical protein
MPLKAKVNGQIVRAPLLSLDEWDALQKQKPHIEMCCCATRGYMRVRLGTPHFVHFNRSPDCIWKPESPEHQTLKALVMRTVADAGWDADIEVAGPDRKWIADVFATKNRAKLAFEIQLSPITHDELWRRHQAYEQCRVRDCWFVKGPVGKDYLNDPSDDTPVFLLRQEKEGVGDVDTVFKVSLNPQHTLPIEDAVRALLGRQFQWCAKQRIRRKEWISIVQIPRCWECRKPFHTFLLESSSARCDGYPERERPISEWRLLEPGIVAAVQEFLNQQPGESSFNVAFPFVLQHPVSGSDDVAFSCRQCGYTYSWIHDRWFWKRHCEPTVSIPIASKDRMEDEPHWCYSREQDFCC